MSNKTGRPRKTRAAAKPSAASPPRSRASAHESPSGDAVWLPALAIITAAILAYLPVLKAKFIWDDDVHFVLNPNMMSWAGLGRIWTEDVFYYPLTSTTFWILRRIIDLNASSYHLFNVLVHGVNAALLWRVLRGLGARGARLAGLLFAVHPVCVQSVAWVTELKNTQSGFFYLLSVWAFVHYARGSANRWLGVSLALFPLALLSKTSTVTLPFALTLIHFWMRKPLDRRALVSLLPFFALSALAGALTIFFHKSHVDGPDWDESLIQRTLIAARALFFYPQKLLWPVNLSFVYPRWDPASGTGWMWLAGTLAVGVALTLARSPGSRAVKFGAAYFALSLLPVLNFFRMYYTLYSYVADHWQYLAAMGPIALAGAGLTVAADRLRRFSSAEWAPWAPAAAVAVALSALSFHQCRAYATLPTLWEDTLRKNPDCWLAWNGTGQAHEMAGRTEDAIEAFEKGVRVRPDNVKLLNNLAGNLITAGRANEAMGYLEQAIQADPEDEVAYFNLGRIHLEKREYATAAEQFRMAIARRPRYAAAHANLGASLMEMGEMREAETFLRKAMELDPKRSQTRIQYAIYLTRVARADDARKILLEGGLNPAGLGL